MVQDFNRSHFEILFNDDVRLDFPGLNNRIRRTDTNNIEVAAHKRLAARVHNTGAPHKSALAHKLASARSLARVDSR